MVVEGTTKHRGGAARRALRCFDLNAKGLVRQLNRSAPHLQMVKRGMRYREQGQMGKSFICEHKR